MAWYFIEPCDVWMFRDGRPFAAGESHLIQSVFPPSPLTIQGALRTLVMARSGHGWDSGSPDPQVGVGDDLGAFAMHGPYLAARDGDQIRQLTVMPADMAFTKDQNFVLLEPEQPSGATNWPDQSSLTPLVATAEIDDLPDTCWLSVDAFENEYISRNNPPQRGTRTRQHRWWSGVYFAQDLVQDEPRLGIGLDYLTRRPVESMLYRAAFKRLSPDVGLLVWVDDAVPICTDETIITLGAESHMARISPCQPDQVLADPPYGQTIAQGGYLKLILQTPAYFGGNWQPSSWQRFFGGTEPGLLAAAVPRPQTIGGWNLAERHARDMLRLVPAGSVYYFETTTAPVGPLTEQPVGFPPFERLGFGRFSAAAFQEAR